MFYFGPGILQNGSNLHFANKAVRKAFIDKHTFRDLQRNVGGNIAELIKTAINSFVLNFTNPKVGLKLLFNLRNVIQKRTNDSNRNQICKKRKFRGNIQLIGKTKKL